MVRNWKAVLSVKEKRAKKKKGKGKLTKSKGEL